MTIGKAVRCLSVGLLIGIIAIGLLPFLVIYSWAEIFSIIEIEASPILILIDKFIGKPKTKWPRD